MSEYIPIAQPNAGTLSKLDALKPSTVSGDRTYPYFELLMPSTYTLHPAIDALIVGIETQAGYLSSKKTWTRKIVLVTDGENPIEVEDWEATVKKMDALNISLTIMSVSSRLNALKLMNSTYSEVLTSTTKNSLTQSPTKPTSK